MGEPTATAFERSTDVQVWLDAEDLPSQDSPVSSPSAAVRFFPNHVVMVPVEVRCGLVDVDGSLLRATISVTSFGPSDVVHFFEDSGFVGTSGICREEEPILRFVLTIVVGDPSWTKDEIRVQAIYDDVADVRKLANYNPGLMGTNPLFSTVTLPISVPRRVGDQ